MKVKVIVSNNPYFQSSASANRWQTLLSGLDELGVSLELLIYDGYQSEYEVNAERELNNIDFNYLHTYFPKGYWSKRAYNYIGRYFFQRKTKDRIFKSIERNDIVWTDVSAFSFDVVSQLKKQFPEVLLFTEMSEFLDIHKYNTGNLLQRLQGDLKQKKFETKAFYHYDAIALMTQTLMAHYANFPQPHPAFLHLPMTVDIDRFEGEKELIDGFVSPYIAFTGVMNDAKDGVSILIKAFDQIKDKFPQHKLYLVGAWNYDTPLHLQLINDLKLKGRVVWMKEYPSAQIPNIICNADVLVLPRPDSKQAQGGFPTKLGEYLATGNPVCATEVGEIPNYLTENESVFFATPGSVESFASAMDLALRDRKNSLRVGVNGKEVAVQQFNKRIQSKQLYDFLVHLESKNDIDNKN